MPVSKFLRINKLHTVGDKSELPPIQRSIPGKLLQITSSRSIKMKSSATVLDIGEKGLKDYFNNYNIIFLSSDFL